MIWKTNAGSRREEFIAGSAKCVEKLATVPHFPAMFVGSHASFTGCEATSTGCHATPLGKRATSPGSRVFPNDCNIFPSERTAKAGNKLGKALDKPSFPVDGHEKAGGKAMPSLDGVLLFNGFLTLSSNIARYPSEWSGIPLPTRRFDWLLRSRRMRRSEGPTARLRFPRSLDFFSRHRGICWSN